MDERLSSVLSSVLIRDLCRCCICMYIVGLALLFNLSFAVTKYRITDLFVIYQNIEFLKYHSFAPKTKGD